MFALVTAFLIVGASSQAQPATPSTALAVPAAAAAAPEKKICRREQEVGSIMPKRTCHTKAEWDAIDRVIAGDADKMLRDYRSRHSN